MRAFGLLIVLVLAANVAVNSAANILIPRQHAVNSSFTRAAAKQLRRYLHIIGADPTISDVIAVTQPAEVETAVSTGRTSFVLSPVDIATSLLKLPAACLPETTESAFAICSHKEGNLLTVIGASDAAVFYGVHSLLEQFGIRFGLDGVVLPTKARAISTRLQAGFQLRQAPVFTLRGLQVGVTSHSL